MRILYTGFESFGGEKVNPSWQAVCLLPGEIAGAEVVRVELPTAFRRGPEALLEALDQYRPDCVICVGQAGGRAAVTPEFVATNHADARIPDNDGDRPIGASLVEDGPAAYFTRLPARAIVERCKAAGIPAALSYTAGTYVCNAVMYTLLDAIQKHFPSMIGGFIHVPYSSVQAAAQLRPEPSMALETMAEALRIAGEESLAILREDNHPS